MNSPRRIPRNLIFCALLLQPLSLPASEGDTAGEEPLNLETVVVVASRLPQPLSGVAAQVTVIDSTELKSSLTEDFEGVLKYQPGLEIQNSGTRFGGSSVNIRGISGNRVTIEIDGVPMRDQFIIGAYSNAGRVLMEPDRIKRVEVLHGPASVMYGSNAIGGVLAVTSWDPADLLSGLAATRWFGLRAGVQSMDESRVGSGVAAWGGAEHAMLFAATYRNGHETDNQAPADVPRDPQDWNSKDFMLRYTWDSPAGNRLRLTANRWERDTSSRIESLLGYGQRFRSTTSLRGEDRDQSRRLSADYEFSAQTGLQGSVQAFLTRTETDQWTFEERANAARPVAIDRRFLYVQDLAGIRGFLFREADWGSSRHRVGLGAERIRSDVEEMRDGLQTSLTDGSTSTVILGEEMPVRDFPISRTRSTGLWLQDEIRLADGRWEITPALRWDGYDLDPRPDDTWRQDNPDTGVVAVKEDRITPRLGVLFRAGAHWTLYGQYAGGFRAPPFEDANIGFDIPLFGFRAIPNPDLRSETSRGLEFGLRRHAPASWLSAAVFRTEYDDFIESRALIGRDPLTGDLLFQSRNIDRARIEGIDLRFEQDMSAWADALAGWTTSLAAFWAQGENRRSGAPLNSIAPPQAVAGLSWTSPTAAWDLSAHATLTDSKDQGEIDANEGERFATPGWVTLDLAAGWRPLERLEIRAAVFNLTDKTYWRWLDISNLEAGNPMIPILSRPGRSYSLTARISF